MNTITTTAARRLIKEQTGVAYNRETFRKLFALMVESEDAQAGEPGNAGLVLASAMPKWIAYVTKRSTRIESGEWEQYRPYKLEDVIDEHNPI